MAARPPPFRADHVGSLLRPPELLEARERHAAARSTPTSCAAIEDAAIARRRRAAARRRPAVGDRRRVPPRVVAHGLHLPARRRLARCATRRCTCSSATPQGDDRVRAAVAARRRAGSARRRRSSATRSRSCGRSARPTADAEADDPVAEHGPLPRRPGGDRRRRSTRTSTRSGPTSPPPTPRRCAGSASAGCTYLQFDDTSLAYLNDPAQREHVREIGGDAEHQHEAYIRHINEALAGRPEGMAVTTHMCRGNFRSSWVAEGGYDFVAEALFNELAVDGFFMEWDDARSGGFEPLRFVPKGKVVVLGLVTTKRGELEDADVLKRRIEEASQFVDARPAVPVAPVRLLVHRRGQRADAASSRLPSSGAWSRSPRTCGASRWRWRWSAPRARSSRSGAATP